MKKRNCQLDSNLVSSKLTVRWGSLFQGEEWGGMGGKGRSQESGEAGHVVETVPLARLSGRLGVEGGTHGAGRRAKEKGAVDGDWSMGGGDRPAPEWLPTGADPDATENWHIATRHRRFVAIWGIDAGQRPVVGR